MHVHMPVASLFPKYLASICECKSKRKSLVGLKRVSEDGSMTELFEHLSQGSHFQGFVAANF